MAKYESSKPTMPEYKPEKVSHLRTAITNLLLMLAYHFVSWLLAVFVFGVWPNLLYSLSTLVVMGVILTCTYIKNGERKRAYLTATSAEIRGAENVAEGAARYRKLALTEGIACTLSAGVLWMIPTLFYTISLALSGQGYGYEDAWPLEKFFVAFIGLCEPFRNAWIGLLLGLGILFCFHYFGRLYAHKKWEENRIRH